MRERLCSAWTVTLQVQTLRTLPLHCASSDARARACAEATAAQFETSSNGC